MKNQIAASELILNPDGSIYHLGLNPVDLADVVIVVGDQGRVAKISSHFEVIEKIINNREFTSHTGTFKGKRMTALSTGIGSDNIDIVMNELDALANIDFATRQPKARRKALNIIRVGTSGALQPDMPVGTHVMTAVALGLDGLKYYYEIPDDKTIADLSQAMDKHLNWDPRLAKPYLVKGSEKLIELIGEDMVMGITVTATGFYGPQGRNIYLRAANQHMVDQFSKFRHGKLKITNLEMESSALYCLGEAMGHHCCTCCVILANRISKDFAANHDELVEDLIIKVLNRLSQL